MSTSAPPPGAPSAPVDEAPDSATEEDVSARKRAGWLFRNSKMWIVALVVLGLAAAVAVASLSVFTSSSANPENTFTAGNLSQSNSKEGAAILSAANMVPGDSDVGEVTIENTGDTDGKFRLSSSNLTDTPGPNGGDLSTVLTLRVVDANGQAVYAGNYDAMPGNGIDLGTWAAGEEHTYEFTVTFPDSGVPGSATTGDNAYKSSSTKIQFNWDATS